MDMPSIKRGVRKISGEKDYKILRKIIKATQNQKRYTRYLRYIEKLRVFPTSSIDFKDNNISVESFFGVIVYHWEINTCFIYPSSVLLFDRYQILISILPENTQMLDGILKVSNVRPRLLDKLLWQLEIEC